MDKELGLHEPVALLGDTFHKSWTNTMAIISYCSPRGSRAIGSWERSRLADIIMH